MFLISREGRMPRQDRRRVAMRPIDQITSRILVVRGRRVIFDSGLAQLYGVETRRLNEQVRRNLPRFPHEFMFQLSDQELARLMSQFATSKRGRGGVRKPPLAFTEHGALMAATVLNSPRAVEMSVFIVRAFVQLRSAFATRAQITRRLDELEARVGTHDRSLRQMFNVLRELTAPPEPPKRRRIGFL